MSMGNNKTIGIIEIAEVVVEGVEVGALHI
jgi:hypothetical protein